MPTREGKVKNYMMTAGLALTIHILLHLAAIYKPSIFQHCIVYYLMLYINTSHYLEYIVIWKESVAVAIAKGAKPSATARKELIYI